MERKSSTSQYSDLYKYNGLVDNQSLRREQKLNELKKRRNDAVDELRNITDILCEEECMEVQTDEIPYRKRKAVNYAVQLMLSEWMSDVPVDIEENWYFKVCPCGSRNLVVANKGITKVYNRRNQVKGVFRSPLPGGGDNDDGSSQSRITLLDCIYRDQTYYVLDIMAWNSMSLLNCSAEFRFYFLSSKLEENPELTSGAKKVKFRPIEHLLATRAAIEQVFSTDYFADGLPVDGLLFFHKDSTYTPGITPLVGWLKPYMLPEKLDIAVNNVYAMEKPTNYTSLEEHLRYKKERKESRRSKKGQRKTKSSMSGDGRISRRQHKKNRKGCLETRTPCGKRSSRQGRPLENLKGMTVNKKTWSRWTSEYQLL